MKYTLVIMDIQLQIAKSFWQAQSYKTRQEILFNITYL